MSGNIIQLNEQFIHNELKTIVLNDPPKMVHRSTKEKWHAWVEKIKEKWHAFLAKFKKEE